MNAYTSFLPDKDPKVARSAVQLAATILARLLKMAQR